MRIAYALVVVIICLLSACRTGKQGQTLLKSDSFCEPAQSYSYGDLYQPQLTFRLDISLTNHFTKHDLLLANALGILPLLHDLRQLQGQTSTDARLERIAILQKIQTRFSLASIEISSLAAELDCEGERADQLATYLDQKDQRRVRNLTLLSVIVGAATTVITALVQTNSSDILVGIGGGLLSAGAGGAAVVSSNKAVLFTHGRNLLTDVWEEAEGSSVYPPFIWNVLNEKLFSNTGQHSIRYNIRRRWQSYVLEGASNQEQLLYFKSGGHYQADQLHKRANMLNQLQSSIRSINQDLQSLLIHFLSVYK